MTPVQILADYAYRYSETPFQLKAGGTSHHYVNCRPALMDIELQLQIAASVIEQLNLGGYPGSLSKFDAYAGVVLGSVPLAQSVALRLSTRDTKPGLIFVRPEAKAHGTGDRVEMCVTTRARLAQKKTLRVLLFEDVWTTGSSALSAAKALRDLGMTVTTCALVDRCEGSVRPDFIIATLDAILTFRAKQAEQAKARRLREAAQYSENYLKAAGWIYADNGWAQQPTGPWMCTIEALRQQQAADYGQPT